MRIPGLSNEGAATPCRGNHSLESQNHQEYHKSIFLRRLWSPLDTLSCFWKVSTAQIKILVASSQLLLKCLNNSQSPVLQVLSQHLQLIYLDLHLMYLKQNHLQMTLWLQSFWHQFTRYPQVVLFIFVLLEIHPGIASNPFVIPKQPDLDSEEDLASIQVESEESQNSDPSGSTRGSRASSAEAELHSARKRKLEDQDFAPISQNKKVRSTQRRCKAKSAGSRNTKRRHKVSEGNDPQSGLSVTLLSFHISGSVSDNVEATDLNVIEPPNPNRCCDYMLMQLTSFWMNKEKTVKVQTLVQWLKDKPQDLSASLEKDCGLSGMAQSIIRLEKQVIICSYTIISNLGWWLQSKFSMYMLHDLQCVRERDNAQIQHCRLAITNQQLASKAGITPSQLKDWIAFGSRLIYLCSAGKYCICFLKIILIRIKLLHICWCF